MSRFGMTIPLEGVRLTDQQEWIGELVNAGYTDVWSSEAGDVDAFTPLVLAAQWSDRLRLGTAIVPAFTRGPACLAQSIAALADVAPGRVVIGIGSSSDVIVQHWNGIDFDRPLARTTDVVRFLRRVLAGERVSHRFETFEIDGFRLSRPPAEHVPILVAALRPAMLRMGWREGDGVIVNWLSSADVLTVRGELDQTGSNRLKELAARIFVVPTHDAEAARAIGRRAIATYLNVPVYAAFHEWLGRGERLLPMREAWAAGDRRGALAALPDDLVDELVIHGSAARCHAEIQRYVANGVTTPIIALLQPGIEPASAAIRLGPAAVVHPDRESSTRR